MKIIVYISPLTLREYCDNLCDVARRTGLGNLQKHCKELNCDMRTKKMSDGTSVSTYKSYLIKSDKNYSVHVHFDTER